MIPQLNISFRGYIPPWTVSWLGFRILAVHQLYHSSHTLSPDDQPVAMWKRHRYN